MKIEDLELVEGGCAECVFYNNNCNCSGKIEENGIIESELDAQVGNCDNGNCCKYYKLKQKEN